MSKHRRSFREWITNTRKGPEGPRADSSQPENATKSAGNLIQVNDRVRVERGVSRRFTVATEEVLSNVVTAPHYVQGRPDAAGNKIEIGSPMVYLDYYGSPVWHIYVKEDGRYIEKSTAPDLDDALTIARRM